MYLFVGTLLLGSDTLSIRKTNISDLYFYKNKILIAEEGSYLNYDEYAWYPAQYIPTGCTCDFLKTFPNQQVQDSIIYRTEWYYAISNTLISSCDNWSFSHSFPSLVSALATMNDELLLVATLADGLWTWDGSEAKQLFIQDLDLPQQITFLYKIDDTLILSNGFQLLAFDLVSYRKDVLYTSVNNNILIAKDDIDNFWIADGNKLIVNHRFEKISNLALEIRETSSGQSKNKTFRFSSYYPSDPAKVQYQYKLDQEENWKLLDKNILKLDELASGKHVLYARTLVDDSPSLPVKKSFDIDHELSDTYWPIILSMVSFLLLLALLSLWREKSTSRKWIEERRKLKLENELLRTEQKVLQLEMNPHFLFNALNSIQGLIVTNKNKEARKYLNQFAQLMRIMLRSSKEEKLSLKDEIKFLKNYMHLERLGKEDQFDFSFIVDDALDLDREIPVFMIQPLLENAILHGVIPKDIMGNIKIHFQQGDKHIICKIEDDGVGRNVSSKPKSANHTSYGIQIIKDRLHKYNKGYTLRYEDLKDENDVAKGTRAIIDLPII